MLRDTLLVLAQSLEPHKRKLRVLFALLAFATTVAVIIAPFDEFTNLITGRKGRGFHLSIRSILQYDFGIVWYPVLGIFILSTVILPALSRRADIGRVWMVVALIPPCIVISLTLWSLTLFFFDINYPSIQMPDALGYSFNALLPALLLLTPMVATYFAHRMGLPCLALYMAATICLFGWFGVISSIASIVTDDGMEPKISLVLSALSFTWGAYTLISIDSCAILGSQGQQRPRPISLKESAINLGAYLSSARNLSVLILVFILACITVSSSYLSRVRDLQSARNALAFSFAVSDLNNCADSMNDTDAKRLVVNWQSEQVGERFDFPVNEHVLDGIGKMTVSLTLYRVYRHGVIDWIGVNYVNVSVVGPINWTEKKSLAGTIGLSGPEHHEGRDAKSVQEMLRATAQTLIRPRAKLQDIAFRYQINAPANAPVLIYRRVEQEFVTREVTLPSLGFGVRLSTAMWWLAISTLVLLIMVRNQIGLVGMFYAGTRSEPWLVLDVSKGLERGVANLWLWAIFLAPWLVGGLLLMTVNGRVIADGISHPPILALARVAGLVAIPLVGAWVAASLVARLMTLRRQHFLLATENIYPPDRTG